MKKYYLEGITEENQRKLFEAASKISACKLYTSYGAGTRAKLKSTGLLSFIRKEAIPEEEFKKLTAELKELDIKIYPYVHEKGMKVSLNLINFISDDCYDDDDFKLQEKAEIKAKEIIDKYCDKPTIQHISVIVKKKEIIDKKDADKKINKVGTSALFEFDSTEATYAIYEKVRIGIKDDALGKVKLFFHNEENNSFLSLVTQGLTKPEDISEKQFEEQLIHGFRAINKDVLQVNVFPVSYNNTYFGRVYLKSEEEGKLFLVDYSNFKSKIYKFYK